MNYERMLDQIPELYRITGNANDLNLLLGLLGWARNEAFGRVADTCAHWGALVHAHTHMMNLDAVLMSRKIEHERLSLASSIDLELEEARSLMDNLPGGRYLLTLRGDAEFVMALKRVQFLREFNRPHSR
ncbi:unnamed protein product [Penicillium salamii]|uniref:Uncharacterized protein n=1 Tax=Penicillium salamii TaxID=1612424 RepID=A0A9W4J5J8_9EURO|nr:unnamed protein product [Penicillium salamii]